MVHPLESRVLLSTATLSNGTLTITGTNDVNSIYITIAIGNLISPQENINGTYTPIDEFPSDDVERIVVNLRGGNDILDVNTNIAVPATINGGDGNDNLDSPAAESTLIGGEGNDVLNGSNFANLMQGGAGTDNLYGNAGNDILEGGTENDILNGGADDDLLDGGLGAEDLSGGLGRDTVTYADRQENVTVEISDMAGKTNNDGEELEGDYVRTDCEIVIGGAGNDHLEGTTTFTPELVSVDYNNELYGGEGNDDLFGLTGDDVLNGGKGTDRFVGGVGKKDAADYSDRTQKLKLSINGDADDGSRGESDEIEDDIEQLWGGTNDDKLTGSAGKNTLKGFGGNDVLDGGLGADILLGGKGKDLATYAKREENLFVDIDGQNDDGEVGEKDNVKRDVENVTGGKGDDELTGSTRANILKGGAGNDRLIGLPGNDVLNGGAGNDILNGNSGEDEVLGGTGDDEILADDGKKDILNGGKGDDEAETDNKDEVTNVETVA